jgi:hypothetical protein
LESKGDERAYLISYMVLPHFWQHYSQILPEKSYISTLGLQLSVQNIIFDEKEIETIN